MVKAILFILVSVLVLVGLITVSGFVGAPGWFVDLEVLAEGLLLILFLRGSRSPNF